MAYRASRHKPLDGDSENEPTLPPLVIRGADISQIVAQETELGKQIRANEAFLEDGSMMIPYGDYVNNTGYIDAISVSPEGQLTTHYEDYDTEQIDVWHTISDGSVVAVALDPKNNGVAQLLTNQGRGFHVENVQPSGVTNAIHLYHFTQKGAYYYVCGSRGPDYAMVWRSTDLATWTEVLVNTTPANGYNRFYALERDLQDRLTVRRSDGTTGYWTEIDDVWVYTAAELPPTQQPPLSIVDGVKLVHETRGLLWLLPFEPGWRWTAAESPDGSIWLSNQHDIYRIPPP